MDNDTVRDVCAEMYKGVKDFHGNDVPIYDPFADLIIAAYERDMAAKDAVHKQFRENYHAKLAEKDAEIARLNAALKPVLDYDFGDYKTPWKTLEVEGELMKGCVRCGDGYPLSIVDDIIFGIDALIEMANAIGEAQRVMREGCV